VFKSFPARRLALSLVFVFMLSIINCSSFIPCSMAAVSAKSYQDMDESHWAIKHITKLNIREVITGYEDGTFRPDARVTQLEAVLMAVRNMEADEAIASIDSTQPLNISVPEWAEQKFKEELLFAIQKGLIVPSENNFKAGSDASRSWITQLMVRMIGKETEASLLAYQTPNVEDYADIPAWALGYVNAGIKYNLISGFPNNTFKPLQAVTRAQASSMLSKSEPYLNLENIKQGTILGISGSFLTVSVNGLVQNLPINDDISIFGEDSRLCTVSALKPNDTVEFMDDGSELQYIAVLSEGASTTKLSGTVLHTMLDDNLMVLKDAQDKVHSKTWDDSAICIDQYGQSYDFLYITAGSQVELSLNAQGIITTAVIYHTGGVVGDGGVIVDIVPNQQLIVLKNSSGNFNSYLYDSALAVIISGVRFPTIDDLQVGDEVKVTADGSFITEIELLNPQQELSLSGTVAVVSAEKHLLIVEADKMLHTYILASDAEITIPGVNSAFLSDITVDDQVTLNIENGLITAVTVNNRSFQSTQTGTIVAVDTDNEIIIFDDTNEGLQTFELSPAIEIIIDDETDCDISDLEKDMKASFEILNDKIIYLEVDNSIIGTVLTLNADRRIISLETSDSSMEIYVIASSVDVDIEDVSRPDLEDIDSGDIVKLTLEDDVVTEIDVEKAYFYEVEKIYESSSRLRVEDEDGDSKSLYLTNQVELSIPDISSPDIENFNAGDTVKCTFMGHSLQQVELVPIIAGTVSAINTYSQTVSIFSFDKKYYNYKFDSDCSVVDSNRYYNTLSALSVGDRLKIKEESDGDTTFYLMNEVTASFVNTNLSGDKVYISQYSTSYIYYELASTCYIHSGSTDISIRNLKENDVIDLYIVDDLVYEINKR